MTQIAGQIKHSWKVLGSNYSRDFRCIIYLKSSKFTGNYSRLCLLLTPEDASILFLSLLSPLALTHSHLRGTIVLKERNCKFLSNIFCKHSVGVASSACVDETENESRNFCCSHCFSLSRNMKAMKKSCSDTRLVWLSLVWKVVLLCLDRKSWQFSSIIVPASIERQHCF